MEVLFFNNFEGKIVEDWDQIPESSFLGGGRFSKPQLIELFQCFHLSAEYLDDDLWRLSLSSTKKIVGSSDETLKNIAVNWALSPSWQGININTIDLAGHLLELKHNYIGQSSPNGIWLLFG
ncbi:hypothetical protein [Reinekea sp. G2M2-21]|uniref:hypothetical protein n=1 Tax=Reinekea sp. G2M2-21 TaxID=2788942 RepID=UPI0018AC20C0|nr:hypothetical protein [Reinekea sp. G2M2-21]